jgi:hypothetical protein
VDCDSSAQQRSLCWSEKQSRSDSSGERETQGERRSRRERESQRAGERKKERVGEREREKRRRDREEKSPSLTFVSQLVSYYDFAVNEECVTFNECNLLNPFVAAGKAVFGAMYKENPSTFCKRHL